MSLVSWGWYRYRVTRYEWENSGCKILYLWTIATLKIKRLVCLWHSAHKLHENPKYTHTHLHNCTHNNRAIAYGAECRLYSSILFLIVSSVWGTAVFIHIRCICMYMDGNIRFSLDHYRCVEIIPLEMNMLPVWVGFSRPNRSVPAIWWWMSITLLIERILEFSVDLTLRVT